MARNEEAFQVDELLASAARTSDGQSGAVDLGKFNDLIVYLDITAASGTTPTLDVKLQTSYDDGGTWFDLPSGAFSQKSAVGKDVLQIGSNFGRWLRIDYSIGGTTPSFTFSVNAVSKN